MSWQRDEPGTSWYEFTCAYVDMKWKTASAKYRRAIAQALTAAAPVMVVSTSGQPGAQDLRRALVNWAYNTKQRSAASGDVADVLAWLARSTRDVADLAEPVPVKLNETSGDWVRLWCHLRLEGCGGLVDPDPGGQRRG